MATGGRQFNLAKQVTFALAQTLTQVAKAAQPEVISSIETNFTVRNNWVRPGNAMGVKVLPASKTDLSSAVVTRADWLKPHEEGEDKVPAGEFLAIPSSNVRRTKRDIVQKSQRPKALRGKRDVVLPLKKGGFGLFQRRGKGKRSRLVFLYRLTRRARIRRQPTFVPPVVRTFEREFDRTFERNLREAIRTAK